MKTNRSNIIVTIISVLVYSFILGLVGLFGETVQNGLLFFVKNILPIIAIIFGYFLTIFVPFRIFDALKRNKELRDELQKEAKLNEHILQNKEMQNNILNILNKEDTL